MPSLINSQDNVSQFIERNLKRIIPLLKKIAAQYSIRISEEDCEDYRQEVILILLEGALDKYRGDCAESTYIFYICRRVLLDSVKTKKAQVMQDSTELNPDINYEERRQTISLFRSFDEDLVNSVILDEIFELIQSEMKTFPEKEQLIFKMIADGVKMQDIAAALQVSPATITYHKNNIFQFLSKKIDRKYPKKLVLN